MNRSVSHEVEQSVTASASGFGEMDSIAMSPEEFLRKGPMQPKIEDGWPGTLWDREMIYDEHPIYRAPKTRPTAEAIAADLEAIAGTDRPAREYPEDFFSRDVIDGHRD